VKIKILVVVESDNGDQVVQEVAQIERGSLQPENLGLSLAEAKTLLQTTQRTLVEQQVAEYEKQHSSCMHCGKRLLHKDKPTIVYRTLFGKLQLRCHRLFHCACQEQPRPDLPLVVGMDGGYVRSYDKKLKQPSNFEIMAGKSIKADGSAKRFSFAYCYDTKPQRRIFEILKSQGMQMNQQVTFLSDGDEKLRELVFGLNPNTEYLLDWFHITMRITVMNQVAKGLTKRDSETRKYILKDLTSAKWYLWQGNVFKALELIESLLENTSILAEHEKKPCPEAKKLCKMLEEFRTYILNNGAYIPNYGERWRYGEAISTGFVESTVNQVISKRFVKKQQMRWTPVGAHLLLQVRTLVLNGELHDKFQQWYPGLAAVNLCQSL
jgi:DNA-directed RNA polymerase subunit RPC12/RpoP